LNDRQEHDDRNTAAKTTMVLYLVFSFPLIAEEPSILTLVPPDCLYRLFYCFRIFHARQFLF